MVVELSVDVGITSSEEDAGVSGFAARVVEDHSLISSRHCHQYERSTSPYQDYDDGRHVIDTRARGLAVYGVLGS